MRPKHRNIFSSTEFHNDTHMLEFMREPWVVRFWTSGVESNKVFNVKAGRKYFRSFTILV